MQLSVYRNSGGLQAIMNSKLRKLAERDEEVVLASGIPSTIIRAASLETTPGGEKGFNFTEVPDYHHTTLPYLSNNVAYGRPTTFNMGKAKVIQ